MRTRKSKSRLSATNPFRYDEVIEGKLRVMDANAIVLCREQEMPIRVFNVFGAGNLMKLVTGQPIGSIVH